MYDQETKIIGDEQYFSVKLTAYEYGVYERTISKQTDNNPTIFEGHLFNTRTLVKKLPTLFTTEERKVWNKLWLDKFAFYKVGTLLNKSPKTES